MDQQEQQKYKPGQDLDVYEDYACFHPEGKTTLSMAVMLIKETIAYCRENRMNRLLVDVTRVHGFPAPSLAERYWIARGFAHEAGQAVMVSFALQAYLLDPERFGVTVATNMGMRTQAFASTNMALGWLREQPGDPIGMGRAPELGAS